jgi:hypothetical protein
MSVLVPFQNSFILGGTWALVTGEGGNNFAIDYSTGITAKDRSII